MKTDYKLQHDRLAKLLKEGKNDEEVHELFTRLMQMDPYSAYGKGITTGKRNIKGKGEKKTDKFKKAFDRGAKYYNSDGYETFRGKRVLMYSSEEEYKENVKKRKKAEDIELVDAMPFPHGASGFF